MACRCFAPSGFRAAPRAGCAVTAIRLRSLTPSRLRRCALCLPPGESLAAIPAARRVVPLDTAEPARAGSAGLGHHQASTTVGSGVVRGRRAAAPQGPSQNAQRFTPRRSGAVRQGVCSAALRTRRLRDDGDGAARHREGGSAVHVPAGSGSRKALPRTVNGKLLRFRLRAERARVVNLYFRRAFLVISE